MSKQVKGDMSLKNPSIICNSHHTDKKEQYYVETEDELETESVQILCSNCLSSTFSRVEKENLLSDENTWVMFCGCFGSCYGIYSILSGNNYFGFAKYTHYCPSCGTIIGTYQPKPTTKMKCIIALLICVFVTLKIVGFVIIVLPNL